MSRMNPITEMDQSDVVVTGLKKIGESIAMLERSQCVLHPDESTSPLISARFRQYQYLLYETEAHIC